VASVYLKRGTWYLQVVDAAGRRRMIASTATIKSGAMRLAIELEVRHERQRLGLEPLELEGGGTVDELMEWWIVKFLRKAGSSTGESSVRKHIIGSSLGSTLLADVKPGKIDLFLSGKESAFSARSVNHLRGYLSRAFTMARRMEKFPRANPVADVPKRKVVKRLPDHLRPSEVPPLLASLTPKWNNLFATAIYTGMRKGAGVPEARDRRVALGAGLPGGGRQHAPEAHESGGGPASRHAPGGPGDRIRPQVPAPGLRAPRGRARREPAPLREVPLQALPRG
jgi:hypothetical protein